mmetsp:Transcript_4676/g.8130  ORF Transcript_4676/g.8130 Transcript_4676/m.8130 type:complete len:93 (-) Transcript_4676:77-355(-)
MFHAACEVKRICRTTNNGTSSSMQYHSEGENGSEMVESSERLAQGSGWSHASEKKGGKNEGISPHSGNVTMHSHSQALQTHRLSGTFETNLI